MTIRSTRRAFLEASAASLLLPVLQRAGPARETLDNGITLASPWPPRRHELPTSPQRPPYLIDPPGVITIDRGRQLFVDDFLIEESSLYRTFHSATYHPTSPLLTPLRDWERRDPHAEVAGYPASPSAMVFSDGVFFDPADRLFKMWYMSGYQQHTALAVSEDGLEWRRSTFDVVRGTNVVPTDRRDSTTVWLDHTTVNSDERYKMAVYTMDERALTLYISRDGVHWRRLHSAGPAGDRSTMFFNPFRGVWVFSLRAEGPGGLNRFRRYIETRDFTSGRWGESDPVLWTSADAEDVIRKDTATTPELYNVDAVAYESLLLGLFTMFRGERPEREKPNDVCLAFSRDGFHWDRPWREPFIAVSDRRGDWNWSNVQSAGGCCLVVGDRLYFYVSGRQGVPGTSLPGTCSTGLATLRRDGFASVRDEWPSAMARRVTSAPGTLTTRPVRFSGRHLFVNAACDGECRVEVLDPSGRVIDGYSAEACVPVRGDSSRHAVSWSGRTTLDDLAGEVVRFRFTLAQSAVYAFWVSPSPRGHSRGFVAAGGPGYAGARDEV